MRTISISRRILAAAVAAVPVVAASSALAAPISKADNLDALNLTTSWVGGVVPGATDVAVWDSTITSGPLSNILGANLNFGGLRVVSPAGPVTIDVG
ncbi:MAG: hypothetical protein H7144_02770, partial [Burkholderiales bacterium]|nr:hypothetical protein [Phycisphaerae bacterium]